MKHHIKRLGQKRAVSGVCHPKSSCSEVWQLLFSRAGGWLADVSVHASPGAYVGLRVPFLIRTQLSGLGPMLMTLLSPGYLFKDSISREGHITGVRTSTQKFWGAASSPSQMVTSGMGLYTASVCLPTGLLQKQSLHHQEQEKLLKKGQQIYPH